MIKFKYRSNCKHSKDNMKNFKLSISITLLLMPCISYISCLASIDNSQQNTVQMSLSVCDSALVQNYLKKIINPTKKESLQCVARPFNYNLPSELIKVSQLMCTNFVKRSEWNILSRDIIALYLQANSPESLREAMEKPGTRGFVIEDNGLLLGVIILRPGQQNDIIYELQIRRFHTNFTAMDYKGVGTALLTIAAVDALSNNIPSIMTTAAIPARGFFEKLGWNGQIIESQHSIFGQDIMLPQFITACQISSEFQGF